MIPIGDSISSRRFPWVNLILIALSTLVFCYELTLGSQLDAFVLRWGAVPSSVLRVLDGDPRVPATVLWTLLTSQFIHAGWGHLLGNMLFLWVFGRAVENRLGHLLYLVLYLAWGAAAALVQIFLTGPAREPLVGASGAISGVLGAYLVFFPGAWVSILVPIFVFFWVFQVPALLVLGYWFLVQLLSGAATITQAGGASGGVAFWAHVGGFLIGAVTALLLPRRVLTEVLTARPVRRPAPRGFFWTTARLLSLAANTIALLVVLRVLLLTGAQVPRLFTPAAELLLFFTTPLVRPFAGLLPPLYLGPGVLDLSSFAAAVTYWIAGAILAWLLQAVANR